MNKSLSLFAETVDILQTALTGKAFTHEGENFHIERETQVMPAPDSDRITLYGAATRPQSSKRLASLDLGLLHAPAGSHDSQRKMIEVYQEELANHGFDYNRDKPILLGAVIAPADEEAIERASEHAPKFFAQSAEH